MSTYDTQGWDVVGAITQKSLNTGLGTLYGRGTLPKHIEGEVSFGIYSGSAAMDIKQPIVELAGMALGIAKIKFDIASGILKVKDAPDTNLAGGSFTVSTAVDKVNLTTDSGQRIVKIFLNFKSDETVFTAQLSNLSRKNQIVLNSILDDIFSGLKEGTYELGTVDLTPLDIPDYLLPRFVAFTLVAHGTDAGLNELVVMVTTISAMPGTRVYTDLLIPDGQEGVVLLSNERLLTNVFGGALMRAIPGSTFAYAPNNFHLTSPVPFQGRVLQDATVTVEGNAIHVRLHVAALGEFHGAINVFVDSDTAVTVRYDDALASFVPVPDTPPPSTRWEAEWWFWALGVAIAGIVGPIVTAIIGNLAGTAAVGISQEEIKKAFEGALQPIKWPASDFVTPTMVNLPEPLQMFATPKF